MRDYQIAYFLLYIAAGWIFGYFLCKYICKERFDMIDKQIDKLDNEMIIIKLQVKFQSQALKEHIEDCKNEIEKLKQRNSYSVLK